MKHLITRLGVLLCMLFFATSAIAQFTVTGKVTDSNGEALIGVSILVKGTTVGTVSDLDGNYSLNVPGESAVIDFSYTGFSAQAVEVSPTNNRVDIILKEDIANLEEVVVTGLASSIKRSNLANAVSTISSNQLTGVTTQQTVDGALYGKLTGVNIVSSNGAPGGGIAIRLRGISSLSGNNQPLIIVDGVYITNAEIPSGARFASGANSGSEEGASNRLADLNPADIENIEVLKGASAAAIYGTRANAGVIIITTKKGSSGRTSVTLDQDIGFNTIQRFVGRRTFADSSAVAAAFPNDASAPVLWQQAFEAGEIFDYEEEIYGETGLISDTRLKISGGNSKTKFYVSGGYRTEDGIIKNTGFDRFSTRLNLNHKIADNLTLSSYTNYVNSQASRSFTGNENEGGLSYGYNLAFTRDYINLFPDEDGNYPDNPNAAGNPIYVRDRTTNEENNNRFIQGFNLEWNAYQTDNQVLRFTLGGGFDLLNNETFVYVPEDHQSQRGQDNGFVAVGKNKIFNYNYQVFANYDYFTSNNISFNTSVGVSYLNFERDFILNRSTQLIPLQTNLQQAGAQQIAQTLEMEEDFGIVLQEQINWDDKIIGTVGVRFDKTTLNGDPNRFFAFPRASLAANLANFDFWTSESISQFKLRVAYGETGNSADFGSLFTRLSPVNINGNAGFIVNTSQGNSMLEPETSTELEFGADISLFDNKLGLAVTYYIRGVDDLLYTRALPTSSGFSSEIRNDLQLENRGLEVGLNLNPVSSPNFSWVSGVNFWFNRSEVTQLGIPDGSEGEDIPSFTPPGVAFGLGLGTFYIDEGSPITALWGSGADGPEIQGDTEPDFQLGWWNEFKLFKNIDINFLTHWKQGGDALNLSRLLTDIGGTTPEDITDRFADATNFIEDASYFRLREIGAYYTIPVNSPFMQSVRIGVSGRNLLTLTDYSSYDPEVSTKGGTGLSNSIEVTPFPSSKQAYFHLRLNF
ncbi:MAG: SusC/RagA family TonB-linked outer membrane protein [Saprospiraceae bacterium]|nr:SusC/RagA family TonB-linked outer membrane protein [Saprospiraceae bacterium]